MRRCSNCDAKARPGGIECEACSRYRRRNGQPRPPHTYAALGRRRLSPKPKGLESWDPQPDTITLEEWRRRESA